MEEREAFTIEFPLDKLIKGGAKLGHYVHRQDHEGGWCMRYGDTPRTRSNEFENRGLKSTDQIHPTHLQITEDEIEKHIVIARREAKNSVARLQNLEKLQLELCLMRQNQKPMMANGSDRGDEVCPTCGVAREPGDPVHGGFRCDCWQQ
jgi:hypothetical protein